MFPFSLVLKGYVPHGAGFLKFCKFGTMQYIVLKPLMTLAAIIMSVRAYSLQTCFVPCVCMCDFRESNGVEGQVRHQALVRSHVCATEILPSSCHT